MATHDAESDFPYKNLYRRHWRSDSGELDVFDATSYFAGEEMVCHADPLNTGRLSRKIASEERGPFGGGDRSSDEADSTNPTSQCRIEKSDKKSNRKSKSRNPVSPGSKLATLLNSLFTPMAGKKKPQTNPASHASADDREDRILCGRMKRRSSVNYAQSMSDSTSRSVISASGFNHPQSPSLNPRIWREIDGFSYSKARSVTLFPPAAPLYERRCTNIAWLDQKFLFSDAACENFNYSVENKYGCSLQNEKGGGKDGDESVCKTGYSVSNRDGCLWKENDGGELIDEPIKKGGNIDKEWRNICEDDRTSERKKEIKWLDECSEEEAAKKAKEDTEDGFESDSSSDLFELQKL